MAFTYMYTHTYRNMFVHISKHIKHKYFKRTEYPSHEFKLWQESHVTHRILGLGIQLAT